ncbi:MAG: glycosyltransferase WbuB [Rhodopirellula sp.]|nr:glycosyltransferase WbuB [Rhodopirellula sp.]
MHILFLTDNFAPEVNAPASRTFEHCREWVKKGHKITVLTCAPNFPKGKVFKGYKNSIIPFKETMDGVQVIRVWTYITSNEGFLKRTLDYLSFMFSSVFASPAIKNVDIVVGTSPQFFTAWAAFIVSTMKNVPFVFELRDLWPESIRALGAINNNSILRALEWMELFLYRRATKIVSVTESFKANLIRRGIDKYKISVVTNGVDLARFVPVKKDITLMQSLNLNKKFVAGYIGTHGMAHGLEVLLEAGKLLNKTGDKDTKLLLLGDGACKASLQQKAKEEEISNVIFLSTVSKEEVSRYWSILDVAIIHLKDEPIFNTVIPSKLFECMGMGIPVLLGVKGEAAGIVNKYQIGKIFEPENPEMLVAQLAMLKGDISIAKSYHRNSYSAAKYFDRSKKAQEMLKILCETKS